MSKIQQLNAHLTNMIAAGEVVERPAGIIKELVENSIDAGAKSIAINIVEGGMQLIEVSDDGIGMDAEDLSMAFERHSTSKITNANDLNQIMTFGFRGEALPSIASVSIVEASTHNGESGHRILVNNGKKSPVERIARNKGTTISVKELFLKTPARLKYIKNINYENSIIQDIVHKFAIGNPHIAFSLTLDGRKTFQTYGKNDAMDVFHRIYGVLASQGAYTLDASNYDFKISGIAASPQNNRSNKNAILIFINDRMIRYPKIQRAIIEGYRRHMPTDRYPMVVLKIYVSPNLVDVNVHPSKWEIRLSKEQHLIELVQNHIESLLSDGVRAQRINFKSKEDAYQQNFILETRNVEHSRNTIDDQMVEPSLTLTLPLTPKIEIHQPIESFEVVPESQFVGVSSVEDLNEPLVDNEDAQKSNLNSTLEPLKVLAQMSGKYILAQGDQGLYIIDQHAAMERVRYEYFQEKLLDKVPTMQDVLVPYVFEGRKTLVMDSERVMHVFDSLHIPLEVFGEDAFVLRSVPTLVKSNEITEFVNKVLDLIEDERSVREEDLRRRAIATLACHSSVRFNEYMSMDAMEALVESLRRCDQPYHCPHGRPTLINIEHNQLIKEFNR